MRKILFWIFVLLMLSSVAVASEVGQFWSIQRTAPTNYSYSNDQNFHYMYNTGATWVNLSNMGPGSKFCGVSGAEPLKVIGGVACSDPWFAPRIDTEPANSFNYIAFGSGTEGNATLRFAPGENETIYVNISGRAGSYYYAAAVSCNYSIEVRNSDNSLNSLLLLMDVNNGTVHDFEFTDIEIPANGFLDFNSIREGGQSNMAQTFNITRVPGNTPPNMTYINITPSNPNVLDNLIGFCNATDEDDDQLTYNYTWNKNGVGYTSGITTVDYLTILDSNNYTTLDSEWFSVPPGAQGASAVLDGNFSTYATPFSTTSNLYVNYTMPANITSVIWETKDGDAGGTNYTNTTLTSDYLNNTLNFKITSTTAGGARSEWNAWNHTANDWQLVYTGSWFIYDHRVLLDGAIISLGYNETTKGDNWSLTCWADDGTIVSDPLESSNVTISGVAPIMVNTTITPTTAYGNTTLLGWCNATDYDADTVMYNFTWYKNDTSILTSNSTYFAQATQINVGNLSSSNFDAGDNISIECLAYDGILYSDRLNSSQIEISGSAPDIINSSIAPAIAYSNTTLLGYCNSSDIDADTLKYNYTWYKNTTSILTGQTSGSFEQGVQSNVYNLTSSNFSEGDNITLGCLAYDGALYSTALNSSQIEISGSAPDIVNSSISPSIAYTNTTLLGWCNASDIDLDTLKYNYTWYKNTTSILTGQTSGSFAQSLQSNIYNLTSSNFSAGDNITLGCSAYDGSLNSDWLNSSPIQILGSVPLIINSSISPATAYGNTTLLGWCNASDIDLDTLKYNYTWYKNTTSILTG
ncbi:MAG: hypothetical protein KAJ19_12555, partial [Gammaproteobacteria bacterium]|nr:hypothetical protein [Gammaproteobacteria bacterium]